MTKIKPEVRDWWGPPKEFTIEDKERKISWLELFYDLVYVIAISRITHHLTDHLTLPAFFEYLFLFMMIYWGWLNGSLHHDLHGSEGLRTRLMTLWQMTIIAALAITLETDAEGVIFNVTITLLIMQIYITYLWWSVGIYDKNHRQLNRPWTIIYLTSALLIVTSLFVSEKYVQPILWLALVLNYLPPFITSILNLGSAAEFRLSSSMSERLGLFTIIIFGEVVLGVISGVDQAPELNFNIWIKFILSTSIAFALWWIFFTLVSDRECKKGMVKASWLELFYVPTLMALTIGGISFESFFVDHQTDGHGLNMTGIFGVALATLLAGITTMTFLLKYPIFSNRYKNQTRLILMAGGILLLLITSDIWHFSSVVLLTIVLVILLVMILSLNYLWYSLQANRNAISEMIDQ